MREEIRIMEDRMNRLKEYAYKLAKDGKNCSVVRNIQYDMLIEAEKLSDEIKIKYEIMYKRFGSLK